jgi:uncharacterized protein with GYD domain
MQHYIVLGNFTEKGLSKIRDAHGKMLESRDIFHCVGGNLKELFHTFGRYDFVALVEAPGEEEMMRALLILGEQGQIRTETLVAIPAAHTMEIIKEL